MTQNPEALRQAGSKHVRQRGEEFPGEGRIEGLGFRACMDPLVIRPTCLAKKQVLHNNYRPQTDSSFVVQACQKLILGFFPSEQFYIMTQEVDGPRQHLNIRHRIANRRFSGKCGTFDPCRRSP